MQSPAYSNSSRILSGKSISAIPSSEMQVSSGLSIPFTASINASLTCGISNSVPRTRAPSCRIPGSLSGSCVKDNFRFCGQDSDTHNCFEPFSLQNFYL